MKPVLIAFSLAMAACAGASAEPAHAPGPGDIAYWTTAYSGDDLVTGKFDCKAPVLPALSKTNDEINAVNKAINGWSACYNGLVANLNANSPPLKRIPADVAAKMTPAETEQARKHLDAVYGDVVAEVQASATAAMAAQEAWRTATQKYVQEQNLAASKRSAEETRLLVEQQRAQTNSAPRPITSTR